MKKIRTAISNAIAIKSKHKDIAIHTALQLSSSSPSTKKQHPLIKVKSAKKIVI